MLVVAFLFRLSNTYLKKIKADISFENISGSNVLPPEAMRLFFWQLDELKQKQPVAAH